MGCAGLPGTGVVIVVLAELLLLPGVGSVVPAGVVTPATLEIVPLAPAAPLSVKVTLPPEGSVGITIPAPCSNATVAFPAAGHTAPPLVGPQLTPVMLKPVTAGSVSTELFAALGPLLVTTIVNVTGLFVGNEVELGVFDIEYVKRLIVSVSDALLLPCVGSFVPCGG